MTTHVSVQALMNTFEKVGRFIACRTVRITRLKPTGKPSRRVGRVMESIFGGLLLALLISACTPITAVKSTFVEEPFPSMPAPEITTYILDLSESTNPVAQLAALHTGISDFLGGQSLGNPFSPSPQAPRGLSIAFVTINSAQAPRILLVSTRLSQGLYQFVKANSPNLEGARQLWEGLVRARTDIWQKTISGPGSQDCQRQVIKIVGRQQLLPDELVYPASLICQDVKRTSQALVDMTAFLKHPGIAMGSDVEGAISISMKNLLSTRSEFPSAHSNLVIASDLVDEVSLDLPKRLPGKSATSVCDLATKDAGRPTSDYSNVQIVLVGSRDSTYGFHLMDQVHTYWKCFFHQIGITHISEQSDLQTF
jgi:hypothetical protein